MKPILLCVACISLFLAISTTQAQEIYRCDQGTAPPLFSNKPCASAHQLNPVITNSFRLPPLNAEQKRQLSAIAQQPDQKRQSHVGSRLQSRQTQDCFAHRDALRALQLRRRKGYRLAQAQHLEETEQRLRQNIRSNC